MSLIVAGAGEESTARLLDQLTQLGCSVLPASDLQTVMSLCEHSLPDLVVVSDLLEGRAVIAEHPRLPVVLAATVALDTQGMLEALRSGVRDVWPLPMKDAELSERMEAIRRARKAAASDAEHRLSRLVADFERDQRAGRYIQMGMLPPNPMDIDGFRFQHGIVPSLILSGDFVDYFPITERYFAFYVADVSGHGASSAFVTVLLKNFSRRLRREHRPNMLTEPGEVLAWINRELLDQRIDKFVSVILGVGEVESGEIRLVNGGHFPPAILAGDGESRFLEQKGKPVGLFEDVHYEASSIRLEPGQRLMMFSDGVLDAMSEADLAAKEQRLLRAARECDSVDAVWHALDMDFETFNRPDDMSCLLVQRES
ncbi:MAG: PP2C family protein-serine/threonine phosphatase [Pseudomonadota bacterium]